MRFRLILSVASLLVLLPACGGAPVTARPAAAVEPTASPIPTPTSVPTPAPTATDTPQPSATPAATATPVHPTPTPAPPTAMSAPPTAVQPTANPTPSPPATVAPAASGRVAPVARDCPPGYPIKGNRGSNGWIYHTAASKSYGRTVPEECFATDADAETADYRKGRY